MYKNTISVIALLIASVSSVALSNPAQAEEKAMSNQDWWPNRLDLSALRQNDAGANPYGDSFNYAAEFATLDLVT